MPQIQLGIALANAIKGFLNPTNQYAIAALGETTAGSSLTKMRDKMLLNSTGRRILKCRPLISHQLTQSLSHLPINTFGRHYYDFMSANGLDADSRAPIQYIQDEELAYVMLRYRQIHDFWHVLFDLKDISVESEILLKSIEFMQTGLAMNFLSAVIGPLRLTSHSREKLFKTRLPWALQVGDSIPFLMNVYYEEHFEKDLHVLRRELGIWLPTFLHSH